MAQDTLLGFPAHTLPYHSGEFRFISKKNSSPVFTGELFHIKLDRIYS